MAQIDISLEKPVSDYFDWGTFLIVLALTGIGLLSIYSATYDSIMEVFFYKQMISAAIGMSAMFIITFLPERWLRFSSYGVYIISIMLLGAVFLIGVESHGTKGWLRFGGMSLQPAEVAKFGVLLLIARHLSLKGTDIRTLRDLAITIVIVGIPALMIARQPDFGSATVFMALLFGTLYWSGFETFILFFIVTLPAIVIASLKGSVYYIAIVTILSLIAFLFRRHVVFTIAAITIFIGVGYGAPIIYDNMMSHQKSRIETFLNPGSNPLGSGYNVIQSIMAVGSGGLGGKGYLQGTQTQLRYIPMQWTDFIFSVPTEEFGFIGGVIVILLHLGFILRAIKIAYEVESKFYSLIAAGVASIFLYHIVINIGMAIGLMPVMGIPLPFMSYGGTSLIINMAFAGLLLNAYRNNKRGRSY
ncbi:MAG: rod shape-determining protein RodA [Candidatus Kapaibacterium sp.]